MGPVEENMEKLSQAVLDEARAEAEQVLAQAREKAGEIRTRAEEQAAEERKTILERAQQEAERSRRQAVATAQIKARTIQLENREKLLAKVFADASQQLSSIQQWSDYNKIVVALLREALSHLETEKALVYADAVTLQCLTQETLDEVAKDLHMQIQVKEPLKRGIGVVVETEDGRRRYDNTLETRLSRMQDSLRSPAYHILMGESV